LIFTLEMINLSFYFEKQNSTRRMKKYILFSFTIFIASASFFYFSKIEENYPKPTNTIVNQNGEDADNPVKREVWFEQMHNAAPGTNWRAIERETAMKRNNARVRESQAGVDNRSGASETIADEKITGTWQERGSLNQAGSVIDTEYDAAADKIWTLSAGGSLFRGARDGSNWDVINQNLRFSQGLLKFVPIEDGRRLLAPIERLPHYSDDDGLTWTASTGIDILDGWGDIRNAVVLEDSLNTIYLLSKPDYWADIKLFKSTDKGVSFQSIKTLNSNEFNRFKMVKPHHSDDVYFIEKGTTTTISKINQTTNELEELNNSDQFIFDDSRANAAAIQVDSITTFYTYNSSQEIWKTTDFGETWELRGTMDTNPWSVGLYVSPSNPENLFYGEVNAHRSSDGGQTWTLVNEWWEYYDFPLTKMHADMMLFNECQTIDGDDFLLISNHGGINISYNNLFESANIGMEGLNVSQYYSVKSSPINPYVMFAGTQDQGFQMGDTYDTDIANFDQVISGDYGHIVFSNVGQDLWTVYPGGDVSFYRNALAGIPTSWYNLDSENESVWLPPLMESPVNSAQSIYMAGGNKDGGEGSYMLRLTAQPNNEITATQFDFNFKSNSAGGELSAIEFSTINTDKFYGATTNGRFFYSNDSGTSWEQSLNFVNEGHYLYGQTIFASRTDENTVYLGGSGYSNAPIYRSTDNGVSFQDFSQGLPSTLVFEITANADETLLFAATEAGPFVYLFDNEQWYDMSGLCAPTQTYWSVEYLEIFNTVRFGTYGRGAWDFAIEAFVATKEETLAKNELVIYPNPTDGNVTLEMTDLEEKEIDILVHDLSGRQVAKFIASVLNGILKEGIDLTNLEKGSYILSFKDGNKVVSKKIQIQ
jgi:hypothetical protein